MEALQLQVPLQTQALAVEVVLVELQTMQVAQAALAS
jgi:hypothetical protein